MLPNERMAVFFMARRKMKYTQTTCPDCGAEFTQADAVSLGVSIAGNLQELQTRLDVEGVLVDVDRLVLNDYHSFTHCRHCDFDLAELKDAQYAPPESPLIQEAETDYRLSEQAASCWITVRNLSLYLCLEEDGLAVSVFPRNQETDYPLSSLYTPFTWNSGSKGET